MAYTSMKTWAFGAVLTASEMNAYLRDNIEFLKARSDGAVFSGIQLSRATNQSLSTGSGANVIWTAASFEYVGDWWASGATITVPASAIPAGFTSIAVLVFANVRYEANTTGSRWVTILKNGGQVGSRIYSAVGGGDFTEADIIDMTTVVAGDTLTIEAKQSSGGNLNVSSAGLTIVRYAAAA